MPLFVFLSESVHVVEHAYNVDGFLRNDKRSVFRNVDGS